MGFASGLAAGASLGRAVREGRDKRIAEKREKEVAAGLVALDEQQALATDIAARPPQKQMTIDEYRAGLVPVGDEVVSAPGTNMPDPAMANMGPQAPTVMSNVDRLRAEQSLYNEAGDLETARGLRKDIAAAERTELEDKRYDTEQQRIAGLDARAKTLFDQGQDDRTLAETKRVATDTFNTELLENSYTAAEAARRGAELNIPAADVRAALQARQGIQDEEVAANTKALTTTLAKLPNSEKIAEVFNDPAQNLSPGYSVELGEEDGAYTLSFAPDPVEGAGTVLREAEVADTESWTFPTDAARAKFMRQSATDMGLAEQQLYDTAVSAEQKVRDRAEKDRTYNLQLTSALARLEDNVRSQVLIPESKKEAAIAQARRRFYQQLAGELDADGRAVDRSDSQGLNSPTGSTGANLPAWN